MPINSRLSAFHLGKLSLLVLVLPLPFFFAGCQSPPFGDRVLPVSKWDGLWSNYKYSFVFYSCFGEEPLDTLSGSGTLYFLNENERVLKYDKYLLSLEAGILDAFNLRDPSPLLLINHSQIIEIQTLWDMELNVEEVPKTLSLRSLPKGVDVYVLLPGLLITPFRSVTNSISSQLRSLSVDKERISPLGGTQMVKTSLDITAENEFPILANTAGVITPLPDGFKIDSVRSVVFWDGFGLGVDMFSSGNKVYSIRVWGMTRISDREFESVLPTLSFSEDEATIDGFPAIDVYDNRQ